MKTRNAITAALVFCVCTGTIDADDIETPAMELGTNFWNIKWLGRGNQPFKTHYSNFRYEEDPWNPLFMEQIGIYTCFRFMDFMHTNNASTSRSWATRTKPDDRVQAPMAYEWMIDLCNRSGADMWVTIPHTVSDDYTRNLATLIKEQLNPQLNCWVEWSNETWNGMFRQTAYCNDQGPSIASSIRDRYHKSDNTWYLGQLYHAIRTLQTHEIFVDVFGSRERLVLIMGGAVGHAFYRDSHCWAINDSECNPRGIVPDAYAIAPYVGHKVDPAAPDVFEQLLNTAIPEKMMRVRKIAGTVKSLTGMKTVAYEGGQHLDMYHAKTLGLQSDPRMQGVYERLLTECSKYLTHFSHYVHVGGPWGAKHRLTDPDDQSPKYQALVEWSAEHNPSRTSGARPWTPAPSTGTDSRRFSRTYTLPTFDLSGRAVEYRRFPGTETGLYLMPVEAGGSAGRAPILTISQ